MLNFAPRAFRIQKLESRNHDNIEILSHFKGHTTYVQILKLKVSNIFLFDGVLRHNLTLKDE